MKYMELLDNVIFILYELKKTKGINWYCLNNIVELLNYDSKISEVNEIAKYLEAQGYLELMSEFGMIFVQITSAGLVYVEKNQIQRDLKDIDLDKVNIYNEDDYFLFRKPLLDIVKKMKSILTKNKKGKADIGKDVEILKLEISKINPNKEIIELKLYDLKKERLLGQYLGHIRDAIEI
ncbi:MAG TPA: hypothetical protein DCQ37_08675 [Desulfobacteraceae bacterium]|nr:hypothetical protein [Desulfobacteraceae bacterium]